MSDNMYSELVINFTWQWDNNPPSCYNALGDLTIASLPPDIQAAFRTLADGQHHNPSVVQLYNAAFEVFGFEKFFETLCISSDAKPNFDECRFNLEWQLNNNPESLAKAEDAWKANEPNRRCRNALYYLVYGQRQTIAVMNLYRACFRVDEKRVRELVRHLIAG